MQLSKNECEKFAIRICKSANIQQLQVALMRSEIMHQKASDAAQYPRVLFQRSTLKDKSSNVGWLRCGSISALESHLNDKDAFWMSSSWSVFMLNAFKSLFKLHLFCETFSFDYICGKIFDASKTFLWKYAFFIWIKRFF